ncbi:MAG: VanZ family protein [Pedobacter sp.]|uniref:VanZ family protein n=1 Tax=Pedobacter sp. TaxID=1411316 RepID=UPI00356852EB
MGVFGQLKYQIWAVLWAIVVVILCCVKMPSGGGGGLFFPGFDKFVHMGFFYVLTILLFYGKINHQHNYSFSSLTIFKIIVYTAALGAGIELLQWKFFSYRSAEWWDFGCDMIGVFMGVFSYVLLHKSNYNEKTNR